MTDESTIQCENCGTIFSDLEEVCPYCGQPRPLLTDDELYYEDDWDDLPPEEQEDLLYDEDYADYPEDEPLDEAYLDEVSPPADSPDTPVEPFEDDDIFAVAEPEEYLADEEPYDEYDDAPQDEDSYAAAGEEFDEFDEADEYEEFEEDVAPRRFTRRRLVVGCLTIFLCAGLFYVGIGLLGAYHGLQERALQTQTEAEAHYQKGQEHLVNDSLELAIAEFELALSLNPNLLAAREALRDAQRAALAQPTPTSQTRSAAAESILSNAELQLAQENWAEAVETLAQVRDLDPDYQTDRVSELIYTANYQLGLQLLISEQIEAAVLAFEAALSEQPDDATVTLELTKALWYIDGKNAEQAEDVETAIEAFGQLYREDADYFDVKQRLLEAHEALGDELFNQQNWCEAEAQFVEASLLQPSGDLAAKTELSAQRCQGSPPSGAAQAIGPTPKPQVQTTRPARAAAAPTSETATPPITTTAVSGASGGGKIFFSAFNPFESRWEILSVPAGGGAPEVVVTNGTMPAVSPNGRLLVYRSEMREAEGFHIFDLTSGEDNRITILRQDVLPRWGGNNNEEFLFAALEPTSKLWKVNQGFADGKGDPVILRDGRTPAWSPDNRQIAYQGTDSQGNDPGIYIVPFGGGDATRLTNHESDRSPDFSPDGTQLVYMSTRDGDWDIYTISTAGSAPRQVTTSSGNDGLPVWSPDGSRIAYVSDTGGSWAIYTISAGGGAPTKVADWDGLNRPDWLMAQIWWAR